MCIKKGRVRQNITQVSENLGIPGILGSGMAGSKGTIMHVEWVLPVADPICPGDRGVAGKNEKIASCRGTSAQFFLGWDFFMPGPYIFMPFTCFCMMMPMC